MIKIKSTFCDELDTGHFSNGWLTNLKLLRSNNRAYWYHSLRILLSCALSSLGHGQDSPLERHISAGDIPTSTTFCTTIAGNPRQRPCRFPVRRLSAQLPRLLWARTWHKVTCAKPKPLNFVKVILQSDITQFSKAIYFCKKEWNTFFLFPGLTEASAW